MALTDKELRIIDKLVEANNEFVTLPEQHPNDTEEWCGKVHELQRMIMARDAVRNHPGTFTNMSGE